MNDRVYLSAREAAAELGVQPATLYAYVSRGLIRSVPGPGKQKRYDAEDVRRFLAQKAEEPVGEGGKGLSGAPVLSTRLTMISDEVGPIYRGQSATVLARSSSLEAVATLLWGCESDPFHEAAPEAAPNLPEGLDPLSRLTMALAAWPLLDRAAYTLSPNLLSKKGAALLRYGTAVLLGQAASNMPIHSQIANAWGVSGPKTAILRAALILSADHELNTSAFTVRCAASTRAPLHAALISGLGAFSGPRHGASPDRVVAWISSLQSRDDVEPVLSARLARGEPLPGIGHGVYKHRDPRADCLLAVLQENAAETPFVVMLPKVIEVAESLYGDPPNVDFALAAVQQALELPEHAAKTLFCIGRMVGWIAHALEQYAAPDKIRPRATYIGERPS
ncbi:citrate synthase [Roseibium sp. TrichSKD4]|uniref:citrate/2-methylcitrate synthase n=1 Tax=Roseibium sp. TrichSKD4 TaxID=744980 RepID=UPI0001E56E67|nr:citrate synthase family protein [Roseibium sp. TrichSKD4]EFO32176.1 citrate synthase [Roseibium sp. TrichSKD4]